MINPLKVFLRYRFNYKVIKEFIENKGDCKIITVSIPSNELIAFLNYDVIKTVNVRLNEYLKNPQSHQGSLALKLAWLTKQSVNGKRFKNPIQLLKSNNGYFCHPGTDRIIVMTYLNPTEYVNLFYLWYPDQDKNSIVNYYEHQEVNSAFDLLNKFGLSDTLRFKSVRMTPNLDISDVMSYDQINESNSMFLAPKKHFQLISDDFDCRFLSYHDNMHWNEIKKIDRNELINFEDNICNFGGIKLILKNNIWIKI